jgi:Tetratricopeptide repeat
MSIRGACGVIFAAAIMTLGVSPGRERPVVHSASPAIERLETALASHPDDSAARVELARAYLDAESPGLAYRTLQEAPATERDNLTLQHMEARVLIEQGKAKDALAIERHVISQCSDGVPAPVASNGLSTGCDVWLLASATRRAEILQALVADGVDDAVAEPEASLVAYHKATHEVRLAVAAE